MNAVNPSNFPFVVSINISSGGIPKHPVDAIKVNFDGLESDRHDHEKHRTPTQAVCLQDIEKLWELKEEGFALERGTTGENLTVQGLAVNRIPIGAVLELSGGVILEVTKVRKPCYVLDSIDRRLQAAITGRCGMYAKVLKEGTVRKGETIVVKSPMGK